MKLIISTQVKILRKILNSIIYRSRPSQRINIRKIGVRARKIEVKNITPEWRTYIEI